jgi:methylthioribose-1-phosphate isomerase
MQVNGKHYQTIWLENGTVFMIDQNKLPFSFEILQCHSWKETAAAISNMTVRGAGAIGAAAGFAMAQAFLEAPANSPDYLSEAQKQIEATRPTARDLFYASAEVFKSGDKISAVSRALELAAQNAEEGRMIGLHGHELIAEGTGLLTHCNAGWLAFVDYGSALAPVYESYRRGRRFTVFADETRPRSQGARLTAWELVNGNIPHYLIADNAAAYFMQQGRIQLVIVGTDRVAANGDVANKIGTLEKAIAAKTFGIPFYVAAPLSTFDLEANSGEDIPIEYRDAGELLFASGPCEDGTIETIRTAAPGTQALNPAFDVTPAEYITGFITSRGIIPAKAESIRKLFKNELKL